MLWKCYTQYASKFEKTQQWPQDWKRSVFIPIPKKGNAKECSNYCTIALISHAGKVMSKILQARLQQYVNHELPDVQAGFRKGFSSSHVQMWELDHKEGWALKNWCFWAVVLEKILESPLNSKEIKPVNPKEKYSLEGMMLKLKLQYFGHLMQN